MFEAMPSGGALRDMRDGVQGTAWRDEMTMLPRLFDDDVFTVWDPFAQMQQRHDPLFGKHADRIMKTDIHETDKAYKFLIDLPGFKKEDVTAELKDGYLTITAQKNHEDEQKNEEGKLLRRERYTGSCQRSFYVGEAVREDDCKESFADGILTVEVPKASAVEREERKMITIA